MARISSDHSSIDEEYIMPSKLMTRLSVALAALLIGNAVPAAAALKVFACEPEWGALAQEIGGDKLDVYTATTALQDPHQIQARPSLIAKVRNADLLVCTGAELEIGWLPLLLRQTGNARIQTRQPGNFAASEFVRMLEVPTKLDRAEGDVHPFGNPHIQTDPRNIARVGDALAKRLAQLDPADAAYFAARQRDFDQRWSAALQRWQQQAAPLKGIAIVSQHKAWGYLEDWLGMKEVAVLEPKPGIPPSSSYLAEVLDHLKQQPAKMVIRAAYQEGRPSEWLSQEAHIPAVELPFTVGGNDQARDLFGLYDDTVQRLLKAIQ
jgi:zinc/manganese transport system substrate-binding protein